MLQQSPYLPKRSIPVASRLSASHDCSFAF
jgi:hypothetical protein